MSIKQIQNLLSNLSFNEVDKEDSIKALTHSFNKVSLRSKSKIIFTPRKMRFVKCFANKIYINISSGIAIKYENTKRIIVGVYVNDSIVYAIPIHRLSEIMGIAVRENLKIKEGISVIPNYDRFLLED